MSDILKKVKIYYRINKLKLKAGVDADDSRPGYIAPESLKKAQEYIDKQEARYSEEVNRVLDMLSNTWNELKAEKDFGRTQTQLSWLYNYANNIKDMSETYDYQLMDYFGKSLRDFCERIDVRNKAHHVIVDAHINVMRIAYDENIKVFDSAKAEELKQIIAKAIEKFS